MQRVILLRLRQVEAHDHMHELGFHNMISDGGNGITIDDQLIGIEPLDYQLCLDLIDECEKKVFDMGFFS